METVRVMSDLARSVTAGQNLIKTFTPMPPPVQFYNIRLGLGSGQNTSVETLPSVIATDIANTKFFATFDGLSSDSTVSGQSYKDIPITLPGPRGVSQRRISDSEVGEVAMQTSSPSNGFSLKSVVFQGGSEALCVSNIVIKGSKTQASREDIFIPIGDLGFLCGHRWSWGSILDGNRQRCIWLDGRSDSESSSIESLHIDMKKMADVFKIDKNDELTRTDLDTICTFFGNNVPSTDGNEYSSESIRAQNGRTTFSQYESEDVLSDQLEMEELFDETVPLTQSFLDEAAEDELAMGEMKTDELFSKKPVAIGEQDVAGMMTDDQDLMGELSMEEQAILNREEELMFEKEIAEETLRSEEAEAENILFAQQTLEEELLMQDEEYAEQVLAEEKQRVSPEEGVIMEQALAVDELLAEEELAEKILAQEESLAEEEMVAEIELAEQILDAENKIAEDKLMVEEMVADQEVSEIFGDDDLSEERLQVEEELLEAKMDAEEQLIAQTDAAEEMLEDLKLRAIERLEEDKILAETELNENERIAEEELLEDMTLPLMQTDQSNRGQIFTEQDTEEDLEDWLDEQEVYDEMDNGQSYEDLNDVRFSDARFIEDLDDEEPPYVLEEDINDSFAPDSDTENKMNNAGKTTVRTELRKRMAFSG